MAEKEEKEIKSGQSRKWQITINNPVEKGFTSEIVIGLARKLGAEYFCKADEIGIETGTYHTHLFIYRKSPLRFSTIKKYFMSAHIEKAYGSAKENRAYIRKEGKWLDTDKAETSVEGTFFEEGNLPSEGEERAPWKARVLDMIKSGSTDAEIIERDPSSIFQIKNFSEIRQAYLSEKYGVIDRIINVSYIYGDTGVGKTRSIYQTFAPQDICRITSYRASNGAIFDAYQSQDVLVLEEYNSQIPIEELLTYLDRYPVKLRARYADRTACYTKVFILSNLPISKQYENIQKNSPKQYEALIRRINNIVRIENIDGEVKPIIEKGEWLLKNEVTNNTNKDGN